jgi:hypothetical protein
MGQPGRAVDGGEPAEGQGAEVSEDLFPEIAGWAREEAEKRGLTKPTKPVQPPRRPGEKVLEYDPVLYPSISRTYIQDGPAPSHEQMEGDSPRGRTPDPDLDYSQTRPELAPRKPITLTHAERRAQLAKEQVHNFEKGNKIFILDHGESLD